MLKIMKSVGLLLLAGALCSSGNLYASGKETTEKTDITQQKQTVKGVVEDALGPVIGASVFVKGTTNGTVTDLDGNFSLDVAKGDVIVISYIGYVTKEIKYTGQPALNVMLEEDAQKLGEVVVMGYGGVQKAKTLTASATIVKVDQIAKLPVTSISEGLGGRVTGVVTQQASGAPGETTKIWIRGGSKILYVIDDVVMETDQGEVFFNRLRPDDIASMTILKDASATAVYGPRANDGVVVVTTKRGQEGAVDITFNQKVSIMTPSYRAKGMSTYDYAKARNDVAFAAYQENPEYNTEKMSKYYTGYLNQKGTSRNDIVNLVNQAYGTNYTLNQINDWFDPFVTQGDNIEDYYQTYDPWDMFNNTQPMYQTNLSIRGGSDRIKYYSSLGYLNQKGVSNTFGYEQINVILNTDAMLLNDKSLKFTLNVNANTSNKKQPYAGEGVFNSAMYGDIMPRRPAQWSTGKERDKSVNSLLHNGFNNREDYRIQLNAGLKWTIPWVKGLSVSANVNFNTSYYMNKSFKHDQQEVYSNPASTEFMTFNADNSVLTQEWYNYKLLTGIFQAEYNRSFGKHNLAAMVNYQSQTRHTNKSYTQGYGYPTTYISQLDQAANIRVYDGKTRVTGGTGTDWGSSSYIGRVSYDYDSKYLLQYSANYNASLSYSPDKRWGFFQAVSAGWVISEETFFKELVNPDILNMFKLRGGYGIVGGEIGNPFDFLNQYAQSNTRVLFGTNMSSNVAWYESKVASDLSWSRSRQLSGGVDFGMLKDRLTGSADVYFYKNHGASMDMNTEIVRTDILGMPNTPQVNAPFETSRKGGWELSLNWNDRIGKVAYRVGFNYSYWDERVTRHSSKENYWYYNSRDNIGLRDMNPVYSNGYQVNGLFGSWSQMYNSLLHASRNLSPGTFAINDYNNDGVIGVGDQPELNVPGSTPLTQYGITLGANWNGFDAELFFQGAANATGAMPSPLRSQQTYMWNYGQYAFLNSYLPGNPDTDAALPIPAPDGNAWGYNNVDWWAFDASYLKLKNISVRYDLKHTVLKNCHYIKGLDVSFVVTNAFTWTKKDYPLKGLQDPEFITTATGIYDPENSNGKLGSYPTQRSYTLGVTITL